MGVVSAFPGRFSSWCLINVMNGTNGRYVLYPRCIDFTTWFIMTSLNGNIFRVTGHLCGGIHRYPRGNSPGSQRLVTRSFDDFFKLRLNKRLSKQSWGCRSETPSRPLWNCSWGLEHGWFNTFHSKPWWNYPSLIMFNPCWQKWSLLNSNLNLLTWPC